MRNKIIKCTYSLLLIPLLLGAEAQATIYKCVKANADVYYNDKPCPNNDKESQLQSVKDPEGGYIPPESLSDDKESNSKSVVIGKYSKRNINEHKLEESNSEKTDIIDTGDSIDVGIDNSGSSKNTGESRLINSTNESNSSGTNPVVGKKEYTYSDLQ